ncbi:set domain-containing protein 5 [Paraphaeosphaeria minitans]|uniref:Set domain-containing protein 5 n=1 Tax=Paraphaeosphaeria minitans TaxID=565426 RepID=A0A9P6GEQ1_9PLEO|nr:set domain-containing protein 5 [Paraphaeosphaeria minitans]
MYEVRTMGGKGLGLVATCNIPKGARIISETAIFEMPRNSINPTTVHKWILKCLEKLDDEKRKAFYDLHNAHGGEVETALGIARTNALPLGSNATEGGLFLGASRINHSCCHNAQNTWNANLNQLTIHAFKDIKEGEEICISYLDGSEDYQTRQRDLQARFCFSCTCDLCSLSPSKRQRSDKRLNEITRLDEIIGDGMSIVTTPIACLYHARRVLELLKEEQIEDARIPRLYYDAFQIAIANGDEARAKVFTERAYATRVILEGEDSPEAVD